MKEHGTNGETLHALGSAPVAEHMYFDRNRLPVGGDPDQHARALAHWVGPPRNATTCHLRRLPTGARWQRCVSQLCEKLAMPEAFTKLNFIKKIRTKINSNFGSLLFAELDTTSGRHDLRSRHDTTYDTT